MPDVRTRLGRYCVVCQYIHNEAYLVCDFCNEHKTWIYLKDRYYNYGFCRRSYHTCSECYDALFGPFALIQVETKQRAYEAIMQIIKDKTDDGDGSATVLDYYEAARIAYTYGQYLRKYLDSKINDIAEINKCFRPIWELTYRIVSGEEKDRVKVVNKDPDNLLVQWVPGGKTITEILKEMSVKPSRLRDTFFLP